MKEIDEQLRDACYNKDLNEIKSLVEQGAEVNDPEGFEDECVFAYLFCGDDMTRTQLEDIVEYLLSIGADPNYDKQGEGMTPLMHAVDFDSEKMVKMLIDAGANVHAREMDDVTSALDQAYRKKASPEIIKMLEDAGAIKNEKYWKNPLYTRRGNGKGTEKEIREWKTERINLKIGKSLRNIMEFEYQINGGFADRKPIKGYSEYDEVGQKIHIIELYKRLLEKEKKKLELLKKKATWLEPEDYQFLTRLKETH